MSGRRCPSLSVPRLTLLTASVGVLVVACGETATQIDGDDVALVRIATDSIRVAVGRTHQLVASVLDETGAILVQQGVTWQSLSPAVASVDDDGWVTGVSVGTSRVAAHAGGRSDTTVVRVELPAILLLAADSLSFEAAVGGASPSPDTIAVSNGGSFDLAVHLDSVVYGAGGSGWLGAALTGVAAPVGLVVQPHTATLVTPRTYGATVWLSGADADGSPASVRVTLDLVDSEPAAVIAIGGDGQSAAVGSNVPTAPSVLVEDSYGNPVEGVTVTFAVASGGGSVTGATPATDGNGVAQVGSWRLGPIAGVNGNTLAATVAGAGITGNPVTFTASATAGVAARIQLVDGHMQSATIGSRVPVDPRVRVTDEFGNAVFQHPVTFAVTAGGGAVTPISPVLTGTDGTASATSWTLGPVSGSNNNALTATAAGTGIAGNPVTFTASATAAVGAIQLVQGDAQNGTVGAPLAVAPRVRVVDTDGQPVAGHPVTFAVATGGGSVVPTTTVLTLADGTASASVWTLGVVAGIDNNTLTVTADGAAIAGNPVTFTASASADVADTILVVAGDGQTGTAGDAVAVDPQVEVRDRYGNPVSGHPVTFAIGAGVGAYVDPAFAIATDAMGRAAPNVWEVGTRAGTNNNSLTATAAGAGIGGNPVTFTASAIAGPPSRIAKIAGDSLTTITDNYVAVAPTIEVQDFYGNAVGAGVPVRYLPSRNGMVGSLTGTTDASGRASVPWRVTQSGHGWNWVDGTFVNTLTAWVDIPGLYALTTFTGFAIYSYQTHVNPIFLGCGGCHTGSPGTSNLSFDGDAQADYAALYDVTPYCDGGSQYVRRVRSGGTSFAGDLSVLLLLVHPYLDDYGNCGRNGTPAYNHIEFAWDSEPLEILSAWIANGAPNN